MAVPPAENTGLVTLTPEILTEITTWSALDVGDVVYLWKGAPPTTSGRQKLMCVCVAFASNSKALTGSTGARLENLFWRIWSSDRLLGELDGKGLVRLGRGVLGDMSFGREKVCIFFLVLPYRFG